MYNVEELKFRSKPRLEKEEYLVVTAQTLIMDKYQPSYFTLQVNVRDGKRFLKKTYLVAHKRLILK